VSDGEVTFGVDGVNPPDLRRKHPAGTEVRFRIALVSVLAACIGFFAGLIAFVLYNLIGLFTNIFFFHRLSFAFSSARNNHLGIWVIFVPVIGGIIVGIMARYGSEKIRGHGIPEAMEAVLVNRSRIAPRVALLKPISAAIAIGTGGPFGAEGPIIQTGGAVGSLVGQFMHSTAAERKVLLACGAAAGMAATFSTPIAGVILAIELLLFEFKSRSFIPLVIASTIATSVHFWLMGRGPMFDVSVVDFSACRMRCRFTCYWAYSAALLRWDSAARFTGLKTNSRSCLLMTCGGRPSARSGWVSSATLCRGCSGWAMTPSPTSSIPSCCSVLYWQ
jgi:H+/Cl- antiporter ClcA